MRKLLAIPAVGLGEAGDILHHALGLLLLDHVAKVGSTTRNSTCISSSVSTVRPRNARTTAFMLLSSNPCTTVSRCHRRQLSMQARSTALKLVTASLIRFEMITCSG